MRTTIPNDLLAAVQRAVKALAADGVEGWGRWRTSPPPSQG